MTTTFRRSPTRCKPALQTGYSLLELMTVVGIIGILAGVALPVYNGYVDTSRQGALLSSMNTIRVFQEDYRMREGTYLGGSYTGGAPDASLAPLRWDPESDGVDFTVVANAGVSYQVTATDNSGTSVCRVYPANTAC